MNFVQYIKDKKYFLGLYIVMMLFISLMIITSINPQHVMDNIAYINLICLFFVVLYILIGYVYRKSYYQKWHELIRMNQEQILEAAPESQNNQQQIYFELLKKLNQYYVSQLQTLYDEKKDHQEFIMSWIHEVKLPITASRLLMENKNGKQMDYLVDKLEDELNKIDNYVEQALYYSRIDSFSKDYFITEQALDRVIKNSVKKYAKIFIHKQIHFHQDDTPQLVRTDLKWLGFIVDQIVANALKYTEEGGKIAFTVEEEQKEKRLIIEDDGVGIKAEDIKRVFEKGFTGSIGRSYFKSTGMGLYLAKEMALKLGHDLSIDSEEGAYTKVTIHFPKNTNYEIFY
jgi:signal transduction histidine kinase